MKMAQFSALQFSPCSPHAILLMILGKHTDTNTTLASRSIESFY